MVIRIRNVYANGKVLFLQRLKPGAIILPYINNFRVDEFGSSSLIFYLPAISRLVTTEI